MPDRHSRAVRQAYRLEHDLYRVENTTLAEIRAELEQTRKEVLAILATSPKDWQIAQAKALLQEIDRQFKTWSAFSTHAVGGRFGTAADIGTEQVVAALRAGGLSFSIGTGPMLSRGFLLVAEQSLPLLITNIGDEATARIGRILTQSVLARRGPFEAMQEIGTISGKGVFRSAFERGEAIVRTEYGRIAQTANYTTLVDLSRDQAGLRKEWSAVADGRARPSHRAADGQVRAPDKPFSIGGWPALYPHDPRLPASESVMCRCISVAQDASWGLVESDTAHNPQYDSVDWRSVRTKVVARHRDKHGDWCPGYGVDAHDADDLTADHILPLTLGGTDVETNLGVLCRSCNGRKGAAEALSAASLAE